MCVQCITTCDKTIEEIVANIADIIKSNMNSLCLENSYVTVKISIGKKPGEPNNVSHLLITCKNSIKETKGFIIFRSTYFLTSKRMLESVSHIKRYVSDITENINLGNILTILL